MRGLASGAVYTAFGREFDVPDGYLNTASIGVPPTCAADAVAAAVESWRRGTARAPDFDPAVTAGRAAFADLVGVPAERVAIGASVSALIGLVAALAVAGLLALLLVQVGRIQQSAANLLVIAGKVGANTANIPQLQATAPVLALIVDEAVVQDGYMNALTDGFGQEAS